MLAHNVQPAKGFIAYVNFSTTILRTVIIAGRQACKLTRFDEVTLFEKVLFAGIQICIMFKTMMVDANRIYRVNRRNVHREMKRDIAGCNAPSQPLRRTRAHHTDDSFSIYCNVVVADR